MNKQLILCFLLLPLGLLAQKGDSCVIDAPVFWFNKMDKLWDKSKFAPLHIVTKKIETTYEPGKYRYIGGVLTRDQTVRRAIDDAKKWCLIEGLNVVPSNEEECAVLKSRKEFFLFGRTIWRVRVFSKKKIERKAQTMNVKVFVLL